LVEEGERRGEGIARRGRIGIWREGRRRSRRRLTRVQVRAGKRERRWARWRGPRRRGLHDRAVGGRGVSDGSRRDEKRALTHLETKLTARVAVEELEAALLAVGVPADLEAAQREGERVADRERRHDAARRCRERRVGLVGRALGHARRVHARASVHPAVAGPREDRVGVARDGDERAHAWSDDGEEAHELGGRARVRDHEERVAGCRGGAGAHDAEVAVERLERVEEGGLDACEVCSESAGCSI